MRYFVPKRPHSQSIYIHFTKRSSQGTPTSTTTCFPSTNEQHDPLATPRAVSEQVARGGRDQHEGKRFSRQTISKSVAEARGHCRHTSCTTSRRSHRARRPDGGGGGLVSGRPEPARGGQRVNSGGGSRGGGQQPAPRVTRRARVTAPPETPPRLNPNMPAAYKYFTYTPHTLLRTPRRRTILTDALSPAAAAAATPHVLSPGRSQTPPQLTLPAPHSPVYAPCTVTSVLAITSYTPLKLGYKPACEIITSTLCHKMPSIHS